MKIDVRNNNQPKLLIQVKWTILWTTLRTLRLKIFSITLSNREGIIIVEGMINMMEEKMIFRAIIKIMVGLMNIKNSMIIEMITMRCMQKNKNIKIVIPTHIRVRINSIKIGSLGMILKNIRNLKIQKSSCPVKTYLMY